jgi:hypothetical protein
VYRTKKCLISRISFNGVEIGDLVLPRKGKFYIVDGQHRIEGFRYAIDEDGVTN